MDKSTIHSDDFHVPIHVMLEMDWKHLGENSSRQLLISSCAYLGADQIPRDLLQRVFITEAKENFDEAMVMLMRLGLLQPDTAGYYKIHRVIQESLRLKVKMSAFFSEERICMGLLVAFAAEMEDWDECPIVSLYCCKF